MNQSKLEISWTSILKFFAVLLGLLFLYKILDILVLFFIVLVIVAALYPIVDRWERYMARVLAVILLYLIIIAVVVLVGFLILPPLIFQIHNLTLNLPTYLSKIWPAIENWRNIISISQQSLSTLSSALSKVSTGLYSTTLGFVNGIIALVTAFILTFYMLLEKQVAREFIVTLLPVERKEQIIGLLRKVALKMGGWLRGQLLLCLLIGILDLIGLLILQVPFALTLAIWAGLVEIIPYIGPWLGLLPAALLGFTVSPLVGILVIVWFIGVQQLEANVLVPKIMQKAVGLSPVIIILAILIGAKLLGILGVILAVPAAAALLVLIQEWPNLKKPSSTNSEIVSEVKE